MKKAIFLLALAFSVGMSAQNLSFQHLSETHTLVRVEKSDHYLLLPVQESSPEATVKVLSDLSKESSFTVRLAVDKVDYMVPLDLSSLTGKNILLDITAGRTRGQSRDASADICWREMRLSPTFDRTNREAFRPLYHFSPDYGWMNDPNGMVYKDGIWHLFFQYNPYGSLWGNMTWGHAVSSDLIGWEQLENAIFPDELGTIFSGSAVVDKDNVSGFGKGAIVAMFTSSGANQTQSLAYSNDGGLTFTKYPGNPVIVSDLVDFRDPKLFYDNGTGKWNVILAAGQEVRFYSSPNLRDWTFESSFGKGYGCHDGVWECPDLFKLSIDGKEKYVLLLNINPGGPFGGSATQYFIGQWDGHAFTCEDSPSLTRWMDYGMDHYATVTWSNAPEGRVVALAWMSNWLYANAVPTQQYRSSNSIPRDLCLIRRDGKILLKSTPSPEMEALRGKAVKKKTSSSIRLFDVPTKAYEVVIGFTLPKDKDLSFILGNDNGEEVKMKYDPVGKTFSMDRDKSGNVDFAEAFKTVTVAPTTVSGKTELRLFVDSSSIEVFGDDFSMTNLVFPSSPYNTLSIDGKTKADITIYPLSK